MTGDEGWCLRTIFVDNARPLPRKRVIKTSAIYMQDDISPLSLRRFPLREQSYWSTQENTHGITPERAYTEWQVDPPWYTEQVSFDPKKCSQGSYYTKPFAHHCHEINQQRYQTTSATFLVNLAMLENVKISCLCFMVKGDPWRKYIDVTEANCESDVCEITLFIV